MLLINFVLLQAGGRKFFWELFSQTRLTIWNFSEKYMRVGLIIGSVPGKSELIRRYLTSAMGAASRKRFLLQNWIILFKNWCRTGPIYSLFFFGRQTPRFGLSTHTKMALWFCTNTEAIHQTPHHCLKLVCFSTEGKRVYGFVPGHRQFIRCCCTFGFHRPFNFSSHPFSVCKVHSPLDGFQSAFFEVVAFPDTILHVFMCSFVDASSPRW